MTAYDDDILAWSREQAELLRAGAFHRLDIAHLIEEIEDVGKSEQRELASRLAVLLAHLLKWQYQPERRSRSWQSTIRPQRHAIALRLRRTPSLKATLHDPKWQEEIWIDALSIAIAETGLDSFPASCPWSFEQVLSADWLPDASSAQ